MSDNTESPPGKENSSDVNQQVPSSSVQDRKHLIDTAVRFLKNPKVVPTPVENKKLFLLKKGLTESEVSEALKLSGESISSVQEETKPSENTIKQAISVEVVKADVPKPSIWIRIVKWIRNLVVAGCLTYTTYKLFIRRILIKKGLIYKPRTPKTLTDDDSIKEVKNSLKSLKESVDSMTTMLKQLTSNKQSSSFTNEDNTTALKNEIQSIKNLLLSRDRFPSLPTITPIIPSWQLNAKSEKEKNDQKDDSPTKTTTTTDEKKSESNEEDEE